MLKLLVGAIINLKVANQVTGGMATGKIQEVCSISKNVKVLLLKIVLVKIVTYLMKLIMDLNSYKLEV